MPRRLWWMILLLVLPTSSSRGDEIVTIAGTGEQGHGGDGGPAILAQLDQPFGLGMAPDGGLLFCEYGSHIVRRIDLSTGTISTVAGRAGSAGPAVDGAPAASILLNNPHELCFDTAGNWYLPSTSAHTQLRIDGRTRIATIFAGTGEAGFQGDGGPAVNARLNLPISVTMHPDLGLLFCDIKNHRVRRVDLATGTISTLAGTGKQGPTPDGAPLDGTPLFGPRTLAVEPDGNLLIVLREGNAVHRLDLKRKVYQHVAGTGKKGRAGDGGDARLATLSGPKGIALDLSGNILLCDTENHCLRRIDRKTGTISTVVGDGIAGDGPDGNPLQCRLQRPHGVFVAHDGTIYLGDSNNHKVRKLILDR